MELSTCGRRRSRAFSLSGATQAPGTDPAAILENEGFTFGSPARMYARLLPIMAAERGVSTLVQPGSLLGNFQMPMAEEAMSEALQ